MGTEFRATLAGMSPAEFERHRVAMLDYKKQKDSSLMQDAMRGWTNITTRKYQFYQREADIVVLQKLTLENLVEWYARTH